MLRYYGLAKLSTREKKRQGYWKTDLIFSSIIYLTWELASLNLKYVLDHSTFNYYIHKTCYIHKTSAKIHYSTNVLSLPSPIGDKGKKSTGLHWITQ